MSDYGIVPLHVALRVAYQKLFRSIHSEAITKIKVKDVPFLRAIIQSSNR